MFFFGYLFIINGIDLNGVLTLVIARKKMKDMSLFRA